MTIKSLHKAISLSLAVIIFVSISVISPFTSYSQGTAINITGASADPSAMLDVQTTNKGILIPRMSEVQRDSINMPAEGLMIYQTTGTAGFYYWNGSAWVSITGGGSSSSSHYVGELYGGGIVFWVDPTGQHGLIASLDDIDGGSGAEWGLYGTNVANCESMTNGATNTTAMINAGAGLGTAAVLCNNYSAGGFTDWYLPAGRELFLLASQDILIDYILDNDGNPATNGFKQEYSTPTSGRYWSSTENSGNTAFWYGFAGHYPLNAYLKTDLRYVRAIRAF